jgi:hypothetical protein
MVQGCAGQTHLEADPTAFAASGPSCRSEPTGRRFGLAGVESAAATLAGGSIQASTPRPKGPARAAMAGSQPLASWAAANFSPSHQRQSA